MGLHVQVHEWIDREIAAFKPAFWAGDVYLDENKVLFRAVGEGKVRKQSWWTFIFNMCKVFKLFKQAEQDILPEGSNTNVRLLTICSC